MSSVLVPFTTGVEEIEFTAIVDILRRADVEVVTAGLDELTVVGRSRITLMADALLDDCLDRYWDIIVLPGGLPNANILAQDERVRRLIQAARGRGKPVAAICAAPYALALAGVVADRRLTSHPGLAGKIREAAPDSDYRLEAVVDDRGIITSRGAGTAVEFSLYLVRLLCGEKMSDSIRRSIIG